jgi:ribonuclease Z
MKPSFHHKLVNGPYEDPVLYVRLFREKRALMFDCGDITPLTLSQMLRVSDLFVTHTHIDHFIGFDRMLRSLLSRETPLRVYGPGGISRCVEGKLKGYTWNLIREYPISIEVNEIGGGRITRTAYRASSEFRPEGLGSTPFDGLLLKEPAFKVSAVEVQHEIPCLSYSIQEEFHINVIKESLRKMDIPVGSWLRDLKTAIWENRPGDTLIETAAGHRTLAELQSIVKIAQGQKVSYVTDLTPTGENIEKAAELAKDSTSLYCESFFMSNELERAVERNHLTARETAEIALRSGTRELIPIHFSAKYKGMEKNPGQEAQELFKRK